jgi:hypothetical protein
VRKQWSEEKCRFVRILARVEVTRSFEYERIEYDINEVQVIHAVVRARQDGKDGRWPAVWISAQVANPLSIPLGPSHS